MTAFGGIPIQPIPRWHLALLRILYPHRWWVQRGERIYILRDPAEEPSP